MDRCFNYAIAQLETNPSRGERLNVGLVVFRRDSVDVFPAQNLTKIRAISSAIDPQAVVQALENIKFADSMAIEDGLTSPLDRRTAILGFSSLSLSTLGSFTAVDASTYQSQIRRLALSLIEPEFVVKKFTTSPRTRLLSSIRSAFKAERVLAKKDEGIDSHRVVMNEKLAEGLHADMVLKNGAMHIMQTVDASHSERAKSAIQEIGISSLVFEQARIQFGESSVKPRLIYRAGTLLEGAISPALIVAEHQGAQLINWESVDDRNKFIVDISSLAEVDSDQRRVNFGSIHASSLDVKKLN